MTASTVLSQPAAATSVASETRHHLSKKKKDRKFPADWLLKLLQEHPNLATPIDLREKALVVAPMVDQSDLPFRLLCRQYGSNLAVTPMIHAKLFCTCQTYRENFFNLTKGTPKEDRPLLAQLCGSDEDYVLETALQLQPFVDGIDLNCGCPQNIAKRGHYGAFLLEQPERLVPLVQRLSDRLDIPVSVKVRILPAGREASLDLYQELVEAGASLLTIHGRTRLQKGHLTGPTDWNIIRDAVELLDVPVLANGSLSSIEEIHQCLETTGAAGVMCAEALLEHPALFSGSPRTVGRLDLCYQYLDLAQEYPPHEGGQGSKGKCVRMHLHRMLHADVQYHPAAIHLRTQISQATTLQDFHDCCDELREIHKNSHHQVQDEELSWYVRHRAAKEEQRQRRQNDLLREEEEEEDEDDGATCLFGNAEEEEGDY